MIYNVIIAGLAVLWVLVLLVLWLITLDTAGSLAWAIRRLGYIPLTAAEIRELGPGGDDSPAGEVPGPPAILSAPPWDPRWSRDTRAQPALTATVERDLLTQRLTELAARTAPVAASGGQSPVDPVTGTSKETSA